MLLGLIGFQTSIVVEGFLLRVIAMQIEIAMEDKIEELLDREPLQVMFGGSYLKGFRYGSDSAYIKGFLSPNKADDLFKQSQAWPWLDREAWFMLYRANVIKRSKLFLVKGDEMFGLPEEVPCYRYPGFQYASMLRYATLATIPSLQKLTNVLNMDLLFKFSDAEELRVPRINHVIGTTYVNGDDEIGFHSDKTKDIAANSLILMLSLGERRELHLRKVGETTPCDVIVMEPGALFILGPRTNVEYQHAIVPIGDEIVLNRFRSVDRRVSLVFRQISTVLSRAEVYHECYKSEKDRIARKRRKERAESEKALKQLKPLDDNQ